VSAAILAPARFRREERSCMVRGNAGMRHRPGAQHRYFSPTRLFADVSASKRYWVEDVVEPEVEVSLQGTIRVPNTHGLGYHVRRELIERWTFEKENWRAR